MMSDYISLVLGGLSAAIPFAVLGLLIGIGLLFLFKKKGYLKRHYTFLKILAKIYWVYIPGVFFLFFWFSGSIWTTLRAYEVTLHEVITDLEEESFPVFIVYVNESVTTYLEEEEIPSNSEIAAYFIADELDGETPTLYNKIMKITLTTLLDYMIGKEDSNRDARIQKLTVGLSESLFKEGFVFLKQEVSRKVYQVLLILLIPIIVAFGSALLFPLIETVVSVNWLNKQVEV